MRSIDNLKVSGSDFLGSISKDTTLTGSGTFTSSAGCVYMDVLVAGGGGAGGFSNTTTAGGGGGGGGYFRKFYPPGSYLYSVAEVTGLNTVLNQVINGNSSEWGEDTALGGDGGGLLFAGSGGGADYSLPEPYEKCNGGRGQWGVVSRTSQGGSSWAKLFCQTDIVNITSYWSGSYFLTSGAGGGGGFSSIQGGNGASGIIQVVEFF